jgi:hypothetical protein
VDSTFIAACQGAGLALAAGILAGALRPRPAGARSWAGPTDGLGSLVEFLAAIGGALLFAFSLDHSHHAAWPGFIAGAALALFAFVVARDVAGGAAGRAGGGTATISAFIALFALALAGLSLVIAPVSIAALVALVVLAIARRRRAGRKYEGLRVLR